MTMKWKTVNTVYNSGNARGCTCDGGDGETVGRHSGRVDGSGKCQGDRKRLRTSTTVVRFSNENSGGRRSTMSVLTGIDLLR